MPPKKTEVTFPPDCCGVCRFCEYPPEDKKKEHLICWVNPPEFLFIDENDKYHFNRGMPVDNPYHPACKEFKPRIHG